MSHWAAVLAWVSMYFVTLWIVPTKKLCKGLFTRYVLKKIVPPKRWWRDGGTGHLYRYWLWLITLQVLQYTVFPKTLKQPVWAVVFFGPIIVLLLDDYIFGDDDAWKRRLAGAKNKIKWLMDLPPEPIKQEVL